MSIVPQLTAQTLTDIRAGGYRQMQHLALCPNEVVVQFTPDAANSEDIYAEIPVGTVNSGSVADVRQYMTVIYSLTTDFVASELFRTFVRRALVTDISPNDTGRILVGEAGQSFSSGTVITVLNTYDVLSVPRVERDGVQYANWDIAFRRLLPVESALPSVVVLTDGVTSYNPTASPVAVDANANSTFVHAWASSNSNDTIDSDGTTASPTFTLAANSFRWLRYTFTDSNTNSNTRVIAVWTVPTDMSSANNIVTIGSGADLTYDPEMGYVGSVPAFAGVDGLLRDTFCCVYVDEWINGSKQAVDSNVQFVGYLADESTSVRGEPQFGRAAEARLELHGFGSMLSRTPISQLPVTRTSSPAAWGDIESPTPGRAAVYYLSEHTTLTTLCAVVLPSDDTDYTATGDIFANSETIALDALIGVLDITNAKPQFSAAGQLYITRRIVHLDTSARDAATVVATLEQSDLLSYTLERGIKTVNQLVVYGGLYNSTNDTYDVFRAFVPPRPDIRGTEVQQVVNQLLEADSTALAAQGELRERAANRYAAISPAYTLRAELRASWGFLQPDVGAWYRLPIDPTLPQEANPLGVGFASSTRWVLIEVSTVADNRNGTRTVSATWRIETQQTGANVDVAAIENSEANNLNLLPAILPPFSGGTLDLTGGQYFDSLDTGPPSLPPPPSENCENGGFRVQNASGYETTESALNGESISSLVGGSGLIYKPQVLESFTMPGDSAAYTSGSVNTVSGVQYRVTVTGSITVNSAGTFIVTPGARSLDNGATYSVANMAEFSDGSRPAPENPEYTPSNTYTYIRSGNGSPISLRVSDTAYGDNVGSWDVTVEVIALRGDAFYFWDETRPPQAFTNAGLFIEGSVPSAIPPYSEQHEYEVFFTSTSGPISYTYNLPYPASNAENWSIRTQTCFNGVP